MLHWRYVLFHSRLRFCILGHLSSCELLWLPVVCCLSVSLSVYEIFTCSSCSPELGKFSTNLGTICILWLRGIHVLFLNKGPLPFSRVDNYEITKKYWRSPEPLEQCQTNCVLGWRGTTILQIRTIQISKRRYWFCFPLLVNVMSHV